MLRSSSAGMNHTGEPITTNFLLPEAFWYSSHQPPPDLGRFAWRIVEILQMKACADLMSDITQPVRKTAVFMSLIRVGRGDTRFRPREGGDPVSSKRV
jgi:hypothetical protein